MSRIKIKNEMRGLFLKYWDPFGLKRMKEAKRLYDHYLRITMNMILDGASKKKIKDYLRNVEAGYLDMDKRCFWESKEFLNKLFELDYSNAEE